MYARRLYDNSIIKVCLAGKWLTVSHSKAKFYFHKDGLLYILEPYDRQKGGLQQTTYEINRKLYTAFIATTDTQADLLKEVYHKCYGYDQMSIFDFEEF